MRVSYELLRKNLQILKSRFQILLNQAQKMNFPEDEEILLQIAHKIRQIDGMILSVQESQGAENGIRFTDFLLIIRQLRNHHDRLLHRVASFYGPTFFTKNVVKRANEDFTRR